MARAYRERIPGYQYTDAEWAEIAREIGDGADSHRAPLEMILTQHRHHRGMQSERGELEDRLAKARAFAEGAPADLQERASDLIEAREIKLNLIKTIRGFKTGSRSDPVMDLTLNQLIEYWRVRLDRPVRHSRDSRWGTPGGPLVRFLRAAVAPILAAEGRELSSETIVKKIKKHKTQTT